MDPQGGAEILQKIADAFVFSNFWIWLCRKIYDYREVSMLTQRGAKPRFTAFCHASLNWIDKRASRATMSKPW